MGHQKRKTVFTAEHAQIAHIQALVRSGRYRSASEFLRKAIDEKLDRLQREQLAQRVARYCAEGYADEGRALAEIQAFEENNS